MLAILCRFELPLRLCYFRVHRQQIVERVHRLSLWVIALLEPRLHLHLRVLDGVEYVLNLIGFFLSYGPFFLLSRLCLLSNRLGDLRLELAEPVVPFVMEYI